MITKLYIYIETGLELPTRHTYKAKIRIELRQGGGARRDVILLHEEKWPLKSSLIKSGCQTF